MIQEWLLRNRGITIAIFIGILLLAGLGIYNIYLSFERAGKIAVRVVVVPRDATVTANGTRINSGTAYLPAGDYTFKATKEGFTDLETQKRINDTDKAVFLPMEAASEEAKKWVENNQSQYSDLEAVGGQVAMEKGEEQTEKNPVIQVLPFSNLIYSMGYKQDPTDPSKVIVTVEASPGNRNAAIRELRTLGHDPTQLKIEFNNYESPF